MTEIKPFTEKDKAKSVHRFFNEVAARYDFMNTLLSFGIHHLWKKIAIESAELKPGHKVIDLCGGTGDLSVLSARKVGLSGQVVLLDFNRDMMEAGRQKSSGNSFRQRIAYVQGDAMCAAVKDSTFDAAVVGFGIRNLTSLETGFREMYRILKPGGKMVCLEFSQPVNPVFRFLYDVYSFHLMPLLGLWITGSKQAYAYLCESIRLFPNPDELKKMLEQAGFSEVSYQRLTNGIAVIHVGTK